MTGKITRKKLAAILAVLFMGYLLAYVVLRNKGEIVRWENRGESLGQTVLARHEPWDDLLVPMTRDSPKVRWLTPLAVVFRDRNKVWNIFFFPLCRAEEFFWNTRRPA